MPGPAGAEVSRFVEFTRAEWARLRAATPLPLTEPQLRGAASASTSGCRSTRSPTSTCRCRACSTSTSARRRTCTGATATFLGTDSPRVPFVIGVAGSVAVGKSTTSRVLQALLARWPSHPQVDLITTDGFLLPQRVLEARGLDAAQGLSRELRRAAAACGSWPT